MDTPCMGSLLTGIRIQRFANLLIGSTRFSQHAATTPPCKQGNDQTGESESLSGAQDDIKHTRQLRYRTGAVFPPEAGAGNRPVR